jgi:ribosomal protein S7
MHKKFPAQMKRARCIGEGIRAIAPQCIPAGLYTTEETQDIEVDVSPSQRINAAVESAANAATALTEEECFEHLGEIQAAADMGTLAAAFSGAWKHARDAKDLRARDTFKTAYDARKADLAQSAAVGETL